MFDLLEIIRVRIELPDVRELIRNQDRIDKPALLIVDGVGIGRAIVQGSVAKCGTCCPAARSTTRTSRA